MKKNKIVFILIISSVLMLLANILFAHPHLFIESYTTIIIEGTSLKGIKLEWVWDPMWSEQVIMDCDKDMNGVFNKDETELVKKDYFSGIKDYNYFMAIVINGKKSKVQKITDFSVIIDSKNSRVSYYFFIPINKPLNNSVQTLSVLYNDETIYAAFGIDISFLDIKGPVEIISKNVQRYEAYGCQMKIKFKKK